MSRRAGVTTIAVVLTGLMLIAHWISPTTFAANRYDDPSTAISAVTSVSVPTYSPAPTFDVPTTTSEAPTIASEPPAGAPVPVPMPRVHLPHPHLRVCVGHIFRVCS